MNGSPAKVLLTVGIALLLASGLLACPGPKFPKGPPPEYEDPPAPSWMRDAGPTSDAGVS